jgi:hypothetical protein
VAEIEPAFVEAGTRDPGQLRELQIETVAIGEASARNPLAILAASLVSRTIRRTLASVSRLAL